jgi:hypothetical protein
MTKIPAEQFIKIVGDIVSPISPQERGSARNSEIFELSGKHSLLNTAAAAVDIGRHYCAP